MIKKIKNTNISTKVIALIVISGLFTLILALLLFLVITNAVEWFGGDAASGYIRSFTVFTTLLMVVGLSSIIGLGVHVSRSIRIPLKQIVKAIKIIGEGGVEIEITKRADDEFGQIVDALLETVENIKEDANIAYHIDVNDETGDFILSINGRQLYSGIEGQVSILNLLKSLNIKYTLNSITNDEETKDE